MSRFALCALLFLCASASARQYCWNANYCFHGMTLYNQHDPILQRVGLLPQYPRSALCGPTAAGMVLHGVMMTSASPAYHGTWTRSYIYNQPFAYRVAYLAHLLRTNLYTGTPWSSNYILPVLGRDFPGGGGWTSPFMGYVGNANLVEAQRHRMITAMQYSYHRPVVYNRFGRWYVAYDWVSSHAVAVAGTQNQWLYIHNPGYGMREWEFVSGRYSGHYPAYTSLLPYNLYYIPVMVNGGRPWENDLYYPFSGNWVRFLVQYEYLWGH